MAKPVGAACNLRCDYCYYLKTDSLFRESVSRLQNGIETMSDEVLRAFIRNYIGSTAGSVVSFTWHGGEPTLTGIDFYRRALHFQGEALLEPENAGKEVWNNLQTNGTLIDEEWADFLAENHFDVGLSIDGTEALHDLHRKDAGSGGSFRRAVRGIELLMERGIKPDLLCTVNAGMTGHGREVYRSLADLDTGWLQFIPIVVWTDGGTSAESISPKDYGEFLMDAFAEWFFHDMGFVRVQLFEETALALAGKEPTLCNLKETCGDVLVVERDGRVYSCDHFVDEVHLLGNVISDELSDLANLKKQREFGERKRKVPETCKSCDYFALCHGGCPKDREPDGRQHLCEGLRSFYAYAVPKFKRAMYLSANGLESGEISRTILAEERTRLEKIGRNQPCPCGSGKKVKHCCLARAR